MIDTLNDQQRQAVCSNNKHILVLAGAGSGKTRVLTQRIAYLIEQGISPYAIFAVTFTNKAASEMRLRIEDSLKAHLRGMWVGTFHSIAHRLLRTHHQEAGLSETFQILDSDDQQRLIRNIIKSLEIDDNRWPPRQVQWYINHKKDEGLRPEHIQTENDIFQQTMLKIYIAYEDLCQQSSLVDFNELLLRAHELLRDNAELLEHYQQRFNYILIDEFQDTNTIQYAFIRLLAGKNANLMVVGDDDQSIYGWRGAKIENIHRYTDDFKNCEVIRLEQNYRSTNVILQAANALINQNNGRLGKSLWSAGDLGEKISLYAAFNDLDEARFIVSRIRAWFDSGNALKDVAILYRSNAQSRVLEEACIQENLPYRIYGGLRFYERQEIKDVIAYLRLINNNDDNAAFERIVNVPTRGIGERTLMVLRNYATDHSQTLWQAMQSIISSDALSARAKTALTKFAELIETLSENMRRKALHEKIENIITDTQLISHYNKETREKRTTRIENLNELVNSARQFIPEEDAEPLTSYLSHVALETGEYQSSEFSDCIQLMTLHSAKGLEFPLVFISGLEEGLFPHQMSYEEPGRLEEERRLCYVGITRAKEKLYLSYAECRRLYGKEQRQRPSRFLLEIPNELIEEVRLNASISRPLSNNFMQMDTDMAFKLGEAVKHHKFGIGTIINFEGRGEHARVQVAFQNGDNKWLALQYANLESV